MVLPTEQAAIRKAVRLGFKLTRDPVEFVSEVGKRPGSSRKAHVVLAPIDGQSDYAVCAHIAAAIMGAWFTDAKSFVSDGRSRGCQCEERCKTRRSLFKLAASADLRVECPSLVLLLRAVALVPGSTYELHSEQKLIKLFSKHQKQRKREKKRLDTVATNWAVLSTAGERANAEKGIQMLYRPVPAFIRHVGRLNREAMCPVYKEL